MTFEIHITEQHKTVFELLKHTQVRESHNIHDHFTFGEQRYKLGH